jgi:hypothetical protein
MEISLIFLCWRKRNSFNSIAGKSIKKLQELEEFGEIFDASDFHENFSSTHPNN